MHRSVIRPGATATPTVRGDTPGHSQGDGRHGTLQTHHVIPETTATLGVRGDVRRGALQLHHVLPTDATATPARRDDGQAQAHRAKRGQTGTSETRPPYLRANIPMTRANIPMTVQSHRNLLQNSHPTTAAGRSQHSNQRPSY